MATSAEAQHPLSSPNLSIRERAALFCRRFGRRWPEPVRQPRKCRGKCRRQYDRGQFLTFCPEELRALDVESSKVIDLERFGSRGEIDPTYFDTPYYLYPDSPVAVEALRVIGVAMAEASVAGIGPLTLSRRERMVMVEPRGTAIALFTLRAAAEVRAPQFGSAERDPDTEMVAIGCAYQVRHPRIGRRGSEPP